LQKATVDYIEDDEQVVSAFERDELGRLTAEVQNGRRIEFQLDELGRRSLRRLPEEAGGATTKYSYDAFGAFTGVEHDGHSVDVQRDALGREVKRTISASTVAGGAFEMLSGYDMLDRLVSQRVNVPTPGGSAPQQLSRRSWKYDRNGRLTSIGDSRWGTTSYQYDPLGQLIEAKRGSTYHEVFEYDVTGSLQNILGDLGQVGQVAPWRIEPGNVLREKNGVQYENDRCKRRVRKVEQGADGEELVTTYHWDCRVRLREVGLPDGRRVRLWYDAFARRTKKQVLTPAEGSFDEQLAQALRGEGAPQPRVEATKFLWDGDVLCAELRDGEDGGRVHVHEPGSFVPLLQQEQGQIFTVVNDHLGMPKELLDPHGRVAWAAAHSAWGRVLEVQRDPGAAVVASPFRLLGQYADDEISLCYTRFRYFDPDAGRWCSPDPLGFEGGANLHAFDGTPTLHIDALGLACWKKRRTLNSKDTGLKDHARRHSNLTPEAYLRRGQKNISHGKKLKGGGRAPESDYYIRRIGDDDYSVTITDRKKQILSIDTWREGGKPLTKQKVAQELERSGVTPPKGFWEQL